MKSKNRIFQTLLALFFVAIAQQGLLGQNWQKMSAEKCKCSAEFPDRPTFTDEEKEGYHQYRAMSNYESGIYMLDYSVHQGMVDGLDGMELAEASLEAFIGGLEGNLIERKPWKVKGNEGISAIVEEPGRGIIAYYNVVFIGNVHYQVAVVAEGEPDKKIRKKFMKKFKYEG